MLAVVRTEPTENEPTRGPSADILGVLRSRGACFRSGTGSPVGTAALRGRRRPVGPGGPGHRHCGRVLGGAVVALVPGPSAIGTSTGLGTEVSPRTPTGSRRLRHR